MTTATLTHEEKQIAKGIDELFSDALNTTIEGIAKHAFSDEQILMLEEAILERRKALLQKKNATVNVVKGF